MMKRTRARQLQLNARRRLAAKSAPRYLWFDAEQASFGSLGVAPAAADLIASAATSTVSIEAAGEPVPAGTSEGPGKLRRFEHQAYNGGRMRPAGFTLPVVVDLGGVTIAAGDRPCFLDHDRTKIVGHIQKIAVARTITCSGVVSGVGEAAREVVALADNGFPWRASIGGPIDKLVYVEEGEKVEANGQEFIGPLLVVRAMTLVESSFVSLAGDDSARATILATANSASIEANTMGFEAWLTAKGFDKTNLTAGALEFLQAMYEAEQEDGEGEPTNVAASGQGGNGNTLQAAGQGMPGAVSTTPTTLAAGGSLTPEAYTQQLAAAGAAEALRQSGIRELCAKYGVTTVAIGTEQVDLVAHAIANPKMTKAEVELLAIKASMPQSGPAIHMAQSNLNAQSLEAAICLTAGMDEKVASRGVTEQAMNQAMSRDLRCASIHTVMYAVLQAAGVSVRPGKVTDDVIQKVMEADRKLQAAAGSSTISLALLGNVAHKQLLSSYQNVPNNVHEIAAKSTVSDFKKHTRYRMTATGIFEEVGENGELKDLDLGEETYETQVKTYGRTVSLTRQMKRNDDLGAFLQLPIMLGRGYALALLKAVFKLINANTGNFFHTNNKNYMEGADTFLQISSLSAAEKLFLDQVDAGGEPISIMPAVLATGTGDKVVAEQLYVDGLVNETTTANKPKPTSNPHKGKFKPMCSPYLSNTALGGSNVAFYLFADPNDVPAVDVAYLDGKDIPTVEFAELDFRHLATIYRAYGDFGVAFGNPKGAVKSKGAA